jgi:peptidoglycan/LPS O-acetylase OafA/YrhL
MPGWGQAFPGWSPLVDHGPLPLRAANSIARWWWPILALAGFGAVAGLVLGHDQPAPDLSTRGLVTLALAALVVVLLTLHRAAGPGPLTRAVAEYAVVALLAGLLVADVGQPPSNPATPAAKSGATTPARPRRTRRPARTTLAYSGSRAEWPGP